MELLRGTKLSILEISELCGFNTPSYFTSVFRKNQGITPREFRQKAEKY
jgi:LacI family transcriptional regulator